MATLDQQQTTYDVTLNPYTYGGGNRDIGQSFVSGYSGNLVTVSLYCIGSPGNYPVHAYVYSDNGSNALGSLLASDNNNTAPGTSLVWFDLSFDTPPHLTKGQKYWVLFFSEGSASYYSSYGANSAGGYASGALGWLDFLSAWQTDPSKDLCFKTYMDGLETTSTSSTSSSMSTSSTSHSTSSTSRSTSSTSQSTSKSISTSSTSSSVSTSTTSSPPNLAIKARLFIPQIDKPKIR